MENVQRRAVRCIRGLVGSYEEKLKEIGLTTLKQRRVRGDMIQTYKIVNGIDDVEHSSWFTFLGDERDRATRSTVQIGEDGLPSSKLTLKPGKWNLNVRKHFFSNRVVDQWNSLPESLKCAASVVDFKIGYDELFTDGNVM